MSYNFVTFDKSNLTSDMAYAFDEAMLGLVHICITRNLDYTLCGHATDEYATQNTSDKPTCQDCIAVVKECKSIKEVIR